MKQNISNNIALQKLKEFEELGGIEPTSEWSRSLVDKLSIPQTHSYSSFPKAKILVAIAVIIFVNVGFIVSITSRSNQQSTATQSFSYQSENRDSELQTLSKELLINPISTND